MSRKISGITVELGGDSTKLGKAIGDVTKDTNALQRELRGVDSLLKMDPKNVILLQQKQDILTQSIANTKSKLDTLREAQVQVQAQFDKGEITADQYRDFQRELIVTEKRLGDFEDALKDAQDPADELGEEVDDLGTSADDAGKETLKLGDIIKANLISEAIIGGVKKLGSALKSVVGGVIDLGKQSIAGYAEFEQLVGGVDTLFKGSSQKVQDYANNAYKTAGMGANQYMETVTSFSASLLQSLGGDTDKAADVAHMAMVDMSDNANKMGTDMESIQNAYNGFSKQNYTMLDNLKLGYGGTQSEMKRLLADAQKLSGVKYNINNLNDVYEAIHVVQTELGITGTTALEAEETISGSINAMSASWGNLVVGLADGNADLSLLIGNVIDSALTVVDNLVPVIYQILESFSEAVPTLLSKIADYLPEFIEMGAYLLLDLINGILAELPVLIETVLSIVDHILEILLSNMGEFLLAGIEILTALITGIAQMLPTLIPAIMDALITMTETLLDNIDMLVDAGIELIIGLSDGLIVAIPILIEKIPVIIEKLLAAIIRNYPKMLQAGLNLIGSIVSGILQGVPKLLAEIPKIFGKVVTAVKSINWLQLGKDIINGIIGGVGSMAKGAVDSVVNVGKGMYNGIKNFFGIKSPSRLFRDAIGKMLPQGIAVGVEADTHDAVDAIKDMNKQIIDAGDPDMLNLMDGNQSLSLQRELIARDPQNGFMQKMENIAKGMVQTIENFTGANIQVVMDTGEVVGVLKNPMDEALGDEEQFKERGM